MRTFYFRRILKAVVIVGVFVWILIKIITKSEVMPVSSVESGFRDWYEQHIIVVDIILKAAICLVALLGAFYYAVPFARDIPAMINGNFETARGTVMTKAYSTRRSDRTVEVLDETTGEKIRLNVNYTLADEGDYIEIKYLKHTKEGVVVEHKKKK